MSLPMRNAESVRTGVPEMNFKILLKHINNIKKKVWDGGESNPSCSEA